MVGQEWGKSWVYRREAAVQARTAGNWILAEPSQRGWAEVQQGFGDPENGVPPTLFIHSRCRRLIETLPALQHDPSRPEDVLKVDADEDGVGGDDAADCLRYLVATKARTLVRKRLVGW